MSRPEPDTNLRLFPFALHCPKCEWWTSKGTIADKPEAEREYQSHYEEYHGNQE